MVVDISVDGSSFDTRLGVYRRPRFATEIAYAYSGSGGGISFIAQAGITYHVGIGGQAAMDYVVDGGQTVKWGESGEYILHATTTPAAAPAVITHPLNQTVEAGQTATFTVDASGVPVPSVHWEMSTDGSNWSDLPGETSPTLDFTAQAADNGKQYRAVFMARQRQSDAATLTVQPRDYHDHPYPDGIWDRHDPSRPRPMAIPALPCAGGEHQRLRLADIPVRHRNAGLIAQAADHRKQYHAVFTNTLGSTTSGAATLTQARPHRRLSSPTRPTARRW
jgi:hypothetical protein